jgi:hypothetical protein
MYEGSFEECEDPLRVDPKEMTRMLEDSLYLPTNRWIRWLGSGMF